MTIHNQRDEPCDPAACPFLGCRDCAWKGGPREDISAGQAASAGRIGDGSQTCETPASAATDRGHEPRDDLEVVVTTAERTATLAAGR